MFEQLDDIDPTPAAYSTNPHEREKVDALRLLLVIIVLAWLLVMLSVLTG